ncbi:hypothetical protein ABTK61_19285, partial [Acinetobacter baumannii]
LREALRAELEAARQQVRDCEAAFTAARDAARDAERLLERRTRLAQMQAERGKVDVEALTRRIEDARRRQAELKLEAEHDRRRGEELA